MPSNRNPLTEGKRTVTMRMVGPSSYATGGNTWTFREGRNIRRIVKIEEDPAAAKAGANVRYVPMVIANDGQGNTRLIQVFTHTYNTGAWAELGNGTNISAVNFIATGELAEGV